MDLSDPLTILYAGGIGLAGAVTVLWRQLTKASQEVKEELNECEGAHKETTNKLIDLSGRVGKLEGERIGIERLSSDVLDAVRSLKDDSG